MKRIIVLSCLVLIGATANCQNKKTKKQTPKTDSIATAPIVLETPQTPISTATAAPITEEQKAKMKEINKVFKSEKTRIERDTTLSADVKAAQMKIASKERAKKIKESFTPEQVQAMKDAQKAKKEKGGE